MRSSIACVRCRRSKVKCVNDGVGTTCRNCENTGRECTYPLSDAPAVRRQPSLSGVGGGEKRPRAVKNPSMVPAMGSKTAIRDSPRPLLDALEPTVLTPTVWQELFAIFQTHYSADLPFLHPPTFLKPLRQAAMFPPPSTSIEMPTDVRPTAMPPGSPLFLFAFLALTARFHPGLVAHHSSSGTTRSSNALIASEYYAAAAEERLLSHWDSAQAPNIERTQALLMLGLHVWGMCRGAKAWLIVGSAMRSAQALGLQYEVDLDDEPASLCLAWDREAEDLVSHTGQSDVTGRRNIDGEAFVAKEIRRRTFWSCYIMDRYLSSGKYRPPMLRATELRIQLPASERSFLFAEEVRTSLLGVDASISRQDTTDYAADLSSDRKTTASTYEGDGARIEVGADEGLVSRYIKILEIYGKVIKWSCSGGRRTEKHVPWDKRSHFDELFRQLLAFKASLPRQHALTPQNTQAHISLQTSTPYALMHTIHLLSYILLRREYFNFLPIGHSQPGPPSRLPPKSDSDHDGSSFWDFNARECLKAARDIVDLLRACQEWSMLIETPIVGFAVYMVALLGVYCINFPTMDPDGFLCTPSSPATSKRIVQETEGSIGFAAARHALQLLGQMRPRLYLANGWFQTINRTHRYFRRVKDDTRRRAAAEDASSSPLLNRQASSRDGGDNADSDESQLLDRTFKDFGVLSENADVDMADIPVDGSYDDSDSDSALTSEDVGAGRPPHPKPARTESGLWNAINSGLGTSDRRNGSDSTPINGQFRSWEAAQSTPSSTSGQRSQHPSHSHQIHSFRPSDDAARTSPGLLHSASHSTTTLSQPSPRYNHQVLHQQQVFTPQSVSGPTGIHANGAAPPVHTPTALRPSDKQASDADQSKDTPGRDEGTKSTDMYFGGDDLAAFIDGGDIVKWANKSASRSGDAASWLSAVWNASAGNPTA